MLGLRLAYDAVRLVAAGHFSAPGGSLLAPSAFYGLPTRAAARPWALCMSAGRSTPRRRRRPSRAGRCPCTRSSAPCRRGPRRELAAPAASVWRQGVHFAAAVAPVAGLAAASVAASERKRGPPEVASIWLRVAVFAAVLAAAWVLVARSEAWVQGAGWVAAPAAPGELGTVAAVVAAEQNRVPREGLVAAVRASLWPPAAAAGRE